VPVRSQGGEVRAAINVAMHPSRRTVADCLKQVLPALRAAADAVEVDLAAVARSSRIPLT
jgi:IclR family pca regulon transcriptional regulator